MKKLSKQAIVSLSILGAVVVATAIVVPVVLTSQSVKDTKILTVTETPAYRDFESTMIEKGDNQLVLQRFVEEHKDSWLGWIEGKNASGDNLEAIESVESVTVTVTKANNSEEKSSAKLSFKINWKEGTEFADDFDETLNHEPTATNDLRKAVNYNWDPIKVGEYIQSVINRDQIATEENIIGYLNEDPNIKQTILSLEGSIPGKDITFEIPNRTDGTFIRPIIKHTNDDRVGVLFENGIIIDDAKIELKTPVTATWNNIETVTTLVQTAINDSTTTMTELINLEGLVNNTTGNNSLNAQLKEQINLSLEEAEIKDLTFNAGPALNPENKYFLRPDITFVGIDHGQGNNPLPQMENLELKLGSFYEFDTTPEVNQDLQTFLDVQTQITNLVQLNEFLASNSVVKEKLSKVIIDPTGAIQTDVNGIKQVTYTARIATQGEVGLTRFEILGDATVKTGYPDVDFKNVSYAFTVGDIE